MLLDEDEHLLEPWRKQNIPCLVGHPLQPDMLLHALPHASYLLVTLDDGLLAGEVVAAAHSHYPALPIAACGAQEEIARHLLERGAHHVVNGDEEAAQRLGQLAGAV